MARTNNATTASETHTSATLLLRLQDLEDHEAWAAFVERYAPVVFSWCRRFSLQDSDAADVTQDVLVKLMRSMRSFRYEPGKGRFRGWLKTVTANAVRDLAKSWEGRIRGRGDDSTVTTRWIRCRLPMRSNHSQPTSNRSTSASCCRRRPNWFGTRVKPANWDAWELTSVENMPAAKAATELGVSIGTIYVARSRVNKLLAAEVAQLQKLDQGEQE